MPGLKARLPRLWPTIDLPGIAERRQTYWTLDLDAMPQIDTTLDGSLGWLADSPARGRSLERGPDDPVERAADAEGLRVLLSDATLPAAFRRFIEDPEPRRHIRSATASYLDLGQFPVVMSDGGVLIHFLSDQQWVLHWLLYVGPDGSEAVVATPESLGFDDGETEPVHELDLDTWGRSLAICGDSFEAFLYHYWAMNELFFRIAVDKVSPDNLPDDLREYAQAYPRTASTQDLFAANG
jgi:hypothetical protein